MCVTVLVYAVVFDGFSQRECVLWGGTKRRESKGLKEKEKGKERKKGDRASYYYVIKTILILILFFLC